jgi:hypothetical protein
MLHITVGSQKETDKDSGDCLGIHAEVCEYDIELELKMNMGRDT